LQLPEQQSPPAAQRSSIGAHPGAGSQRDVPSVAGAQRPEQQSCAVAQISNAGWQRGSA
jgi:hypothetical protein